VQDCSPHKGEKGKDSGNSQLDDVSKESGQKLATKPTQTPRTEMLPSGKFKNFNAPL